MEASLEEIRNILVSQKATADHRHDEDTRWRGQMDATMRTLGTEVASVRARVDVHDTQISDNAKSTSTAMNLALSVSQTTARIENETTQQSASLRTLLDDRLVLRGQIKVAAWVLGLLIGAPATLLAVLKLLESLHR